MRTFALSLAYAFGWPLLAGAIADHDVEVTASATTLVGDGAELACHIKAGVGVNVSGTVNLLGWKRHGTPGYRIYCEKGSRSMMQQYPFNGSSISLLAPQDCEFPPKPEFWFNVTVAQLTPSMGGKFVCEVFLEGSGIYQSRRPVVMLVEATTSVFYDVTVVAMAVTVFVLLIANGVACRWYRANPKVVIVDRRTSRTSLRSTQSRRESLASIRSSSTASTRRRKSSKKR